MRPTLHIPMLLPSLLLLLISSTIVSAQSQESVPGEGIASDRCAEILRDALASRNQEPDAGRTVRRVLDLRIIPNDPADGDTIESTAETIEHGRFRVLKLGQMETWTDGSESILVDHLNHILRIVDLRDRQALVEKQFALNTMLPDSLVHYATNITCQSPSDEQDRRLNVVRSISLNVPVAFQLLYNAASISVGIDKEGEVRRFVVRHPVSSNIRSSEYVVREIDRNYRNLDPAEPVRSFFVNEDQTLKAAYTDYRVVGQP